MVDQLIFAPYIVTVAKDREVLLDHALAIENDQIVNILPEQEANKLVAKEVLHLPNHVLMPGLVNLHGHSAMTLLRGLADDLALMDWLNNHIWPAEGKHVSDPFVYDGTLLAMAEMIRGGTTTINDMYFYHGAVARAGLKSGMRTVIGCSALEFPTAYGQNAQEYLDFAMEAYHIYKGESLLSFALAPHAPYTVSDDTFKKVVQQAEQHDLLIHCHIHETKDEIEGSLKEHGVRPLARLERLGVLQSRLIGAHMVHVTDEEIELLSKHQVKIAHNPSSNMKLASGCAPVQKMLNQGVCVGLGTDGAASNNKLDMFADMRLAALIAKGFSGRPTDINAYDAVKMATINGATALGMGNKTGSLEVGKQADLIAIDLGQVETQPVFDPISHIVYAAGREQVTHTWVAGKSLLKNRVLSTLDEAALIEQAKVWRQSIQK
ncbi:TRZ/ATZ family hydrolase [Neisseria sp. Ec49-e6-T10]|uniref:TRZ/ATZ family hydrolase n=1 Tax=Neisseria sp. Ec49-e6-T10 TaxID=3140744 RepID=UPI003EB8EFE8